MFLEIVNTYYCFILVAVGIIGSLVISISDEIYEMDMVLTDKNEFFRCIFMYQFTVYELLKDEINEAGIIILEVLVTLSVWFLNVLVFLIVVFCLIVKLICRLFWIIFKKKGVRIMEFEFISAKINPEKTGHYLVISHMNMYHGGCFDRHNDGTTLSYHVAYYSNVVGWNNPYVVAWCKLPPFPEVYVNENKEFLKEKGI